MRAYAIDPLNKQLGPCMWFEGRRGGLWVANRDKFTKPHSEQIVPPVRWRKSQSQRQFNRRLRNHLRAWLPDLTVYTRRPR